MSALNLAAFLIKVFSTFRNKILALSSSFLKTIIELLISSNYYIYLYISLYFSSKKAGALKTN